MEAQRSLALLLLLAMPTLFPAFQHTPNDFRWYQKSLTTKIRRRPAGNVSRTNFQQNSRQNASHLLTSSNFRVASSFALIKWEQRKYKTKSFYIILFTVFKFSELFSFQNSLIPTKQQLHPATTTMPYSNMDTTAANNRENSRNNFLTMEFPAHEDVPTENLSCDMNQSTSRCFVMPSRLERTEWPIRLPFYASIFYEQKQAFLATECKCWHTMLSTYTFASPLQQTQASASSSSSKWRHIMLPPCFYASRNQTDKLMNPNCDGQIIFPQSSALIRHLTIYEQQSNDTANMGTSRYPFTAVNSENFPEMQKIPTSASGNYQLVPKSPDMLAEHAGYDNTKVHPFLLHRRKKLTELLQRTLTQDSNLFSIDIPRDFTYFQTKTPTFPMNHELRAKTTSTITMQFDSSQTAQIHASRVNLKIPSLQSTILATFLDENLFVTLNSWPAHSIYHKSKKISKEDLLSLKSNKEMPITLEVRWHLPGGSIPNRKLFDGHGEMPTREDQEPNRDQEMRSPTNNNSKRAAPETSPATTTSTSKARTDRSAYQQPPRTPPKVYIPIDMDFVKQTTLANADILDSDMSWRNPTSKHTIDDFNKLRSMLQLHDVKLSEGTERLLKKVNISPTKTIVATALGCQRFNEFRLPDLKQYINKQEPLVTLQFRHFRPQTPLRPGNYRAALQALNGQLTRTDLNRVPITQDTVQSIDQGSVEPHSRKGEPPDFYNGQFTLPLNDPTITAILQHGGLCSDKGHLPFLLLPDATSLQLTEATTYKIELVMKVLTQLEPNRYENGRIPIFHMYRMINHFLDKESATLIYGPHYATTWVGDRARSTLAISPETRLAFMAVDPIKALQSFAAKTPYLDIWNLIRIDLQFEPNLPKPMRLPNDTSLESTAVLAQRLFRETCDTLPLVIVRPAKPWMPSMIDGQYTKDNLLLQEQITEARTTTLAHFHLRSITPVFNNYYAQLLLAFDTVEDANEFIAAWKSPAPTASLRAFEDLVNHPQERASICALLVPHYELRRLQRGHLVRALAAAQPDRVVGQPAAPSPSKTKPRPDSMLANSLGPAFLNQDAPDLNLWTPGATMAARSGDLRNRLSLVPRDRTDRDIGQRVVLQTSTQLERRSLPQEIFTSIAEAAASKAVQLMAPQQQRMETQISQTNDSVRQIQTNVNQVQTAMTSLDGRMQKSEMLIADIFQRRFGHLIPPATAVPHGHDTPASPTDPHAPTPDEHHAET
jgi:hypothetical protein